jgi:hypothetical protein
MVRRSEPWSILRRSCISADVLGPLLLVGFLFGLGSGWKLQDCCILTFLEMSQKHLLAVWHTLVLGDRVVEIAHLANQGASRTSLNPSRRRLCSISVMRNSALTVVNDWSRPAIA